MRADLQFIMEVTKRTRPLEDFQEVVSHLLAQIVQEAGWAESIQAYTALLEQMARTCRVPEGQVADLVQAVWEKFLGAVPQLIAGGARTDLRAWSFCVMRRRASNLRRMTIATRRIVWRKPLPPAWSR